MEFFETDRIVDVYEDMFGNEVNVYEVRPRWSVWYDGKLFDDDTDGVNGHDVDSWEEALSIYNAYSDIVEIVDNEYGVTFSHGEWN